MFGRDDNAEVAALRGRLEELRLKNLELTVRVEGLQRASTRLAMLVREGRSLILDAAWVVLRPLARGETISLSDPGAAACREWLCHAQRVGLLPGRGGKYTQLEVR